ncbi:DMT family transporter [Glycomyces sp. TRM65418]|uniref:DMT family transporter n=1 Tax=Glycomyces sp. TRM65418 TaxID=2867006 RepID=UPI001CE68688|nr:DMT family transporter [Glycomyces sp. TRM65418]MCC3765335.1 DMT family transporter [Glycomyces sp. TRM65418]QZD54952.1 DMT family transporter [Glycomyces sp. TRM65418]
MRTSDRLWATAFVVLWSSGFIGAELATRHASALTVLNWRFLLLAGPALAWIAWRGRWRRYTARDVGVHVLVGALAQVGYLYGVVMAAQLGVGSGTTALIASLQPVVTAAAAYLVLGERVRAAQMLGLAIGFGGVALVISADYAGGDAALWAYALPVAAMLSLVAATVLERRTRPRSLGQLDALAVQFLTTASAFAAISAAFGEFAPAPTSGFWLSVAWMTVLAGVGGYGTYWVVVRRNGATVAATLLYFTPPATMLWAWAMFGDELSGLAWAGLAVTAVGVAFAIGRGRRNEEPSVSRGPRIGARA